jgi:hypothetical protein
MLILPSPPPSSLAPLLCPTLFDGLIGDVSATGEDGCWSSRPEVSEELKVKVGKAETDCRFDRERV